MFHRLDRMLLYFLWTTFFILIDNPDISCFIKPFKIIYFLAIYQSIAYFILHDNQCRIVSLKPLYELWILL